AKAELLGKELQRLFLIAHWNAGKLDPTNHDSCSPSSSEFVIANLVSAKTRSRIEKGLFRRNQPVDAILTVNIV
ncbi:MAG: hypothetical protein WAK13_12535, partial [Terriglobales bacterium]